MGNEQSHEYDGCTTLGYRVLGVQPDSPASRSGLVSFFDFLVGVNGQLLFDNGEQGAENADFFEDLDFVSILKDNVDKEIELLVWNIKSKTQRFINLVPTRNWSGTGLLGVTIRMDNYMVAEENLLRILDVKPGSPAAKAGLVPNVNYLLGTTMESFENEEVLGDVLYENEDQILEVYVYDTTSDVVRVATLLPSLKWGGGGLLGAEVGKGYLHRLPQSCRKTLGVSFERKVATEFESDHEILEISRRSDKEEDQIGADNNITAQSKVDDVVDTVDNGVEEDNDRERNDSDPIAEKENVQDVSSPEVSLESQVDAKLSLTKEANEKVASDKIAEMRSLPPPPFSSLVDDN
jgi:hypothetical protein